MIDCNSPGEPLVTVGLEKCLASPPEILRKARFGLLTHQASVDRRFRYAHDLLSDAFPGQLRAIFSPQHGVWGTEQDNMIETPHGSDSRLNVPVHSLYAASRKPTREMLPEIDCLVVDLVDVGARVYTYIWTVSYCLEACAQRGIPVVVLDRPNPLGGLRVEGPRLDESCASFVGRAAVPMVHGLTIAEMTLYLNRVMDLGAEVVVVEMEGWKRHMRFPETGRVWLSPSPNLPRYEGVVLYPGTVLVEGTNLSEGRGTTTPFEVVGAPFVEPHALTEALSRWEIPGVVFRPVRFKPTFQKWRGRECGGVFQHVTDPDAFRPHRTAVALLGCVRSLWPGSFQWRPPPYEYEYEKMPIDILSGNSEMRELLDEGLTAASLERLTRVDEGGWWRDVGECVLY